MKALKRGDDGITHACVDFLCALMQPMHDNFDLRQEQMNKSSLLSSKAFLENNLLDALKDHIVSDHLFARTYPLTHLSCPLQQKGTGALVINALLDFVTFSICPPYR